MPTNKQPGPAPSRGRARLTPAEFEEERSRFQFIANASRDLISFVDTDYVYRAVNAAYQRVYGRGNGRIVGTRVTDMWGAEKFAAILKPKFDACFSGNEIRDQAWIDLGPDGRRFMDMTYLPYRAANGEVQGAGVTSHDVTELKLAEEAIRDRESRLRALVETSPDWIVSTDADGDYTFLNPLAKSVFRERKNYLVYVKESDLLRTKAAWDALLKGREMRDFENRIVDAEGEEHLISWNASPLRDAGGNVIGAIAVGRDLGARLKIERLAEERGLTPREVEIFRLVARGDSNLNIALALGMREATVKTHLGHVFRKLSVQSRSALAALVR